MGIHLFQFVSRVEKEGFQSLVFVVDVHTDIINICILFVHPASTYSESHLITGEWDTNREKQDRANFHNTLWDIPTCTSSGGKKVKHDANTYCIGEWLMIAMWLRNNFGLSCFKPLSSRYDLTKDLQISWSLLLT